MFFCHPYEEVPEKRALAFGKGVGKTVVFPWQKVGQTCEILQEQIPFVTVGGGVFCPPLEEVARSAGGG